jgi:RHS repeat-associated protein
MGCQPGTSVSYGACCAGVALIDTYCLGRWALGRISTAGLLATDHNGSVLGHYSSAARLEMAYTPYGYRAERSGLPTHLGFNGQRQDSLTGCYHLGAGRRVFSAVLMRFNRPDELSPFGEGGLNCYAYCVGDPINAVDPSGQFPSFPMPFARLFSKSRVAAAAPEVTFAKSTRYHLAQDIVKTEQAFPDLKNVRIHGRQAFSFSDEGVFHLAGHGDPLGNIYFGRRPLSPERAYRKLLKDGVDFSQHKSVYLQICYSAGGWGEGVAKPFARLTGLPTTGHVGLGNSTSNRVAQFIRSIRTPSVIEGHVRNNYRVTTAYVDHAPGSKELREMAKYKHRTQVFRS